MFHMCGVPSTQLKGLISLMTHTADEEPIEKVFEVETGSDDCVQGFNKQMHFERVLIEIEVAVFKNRPAT